MSCRDQDMAIDRYIDGELSAAQARALEEHFRTCAPCTRAYERGLALRDTLRRELRPRQAPDILRAGIRRQIHNADLPIRIGWRSPAISRIVALAAVLVLCIAGTWQLAAHWRDGNRIGDEVLASHVRSLIGTHLTDVTSSDQHTVKPWFNGRLDYSPPVSDFNGQGFALLGGREDYIAGRRVAALVYGRRQHTVNVFLWPSDRGVIGGPSVATRQGYHMLSWSASGYSYWVVSDLGIAELRELSRLLHQADTLQVP